MTTSINQSGDHMCWRQDFLDDLVSQALKLEETILKVPEHI